MNSEVLVLNHTFEFSWLGPIDHCVVRYGPYITCTYQLQTSLFYTSDKMDRLVSFVRLEWNCRKITACVHFWAYYTSGGIWSGFESVEGLDCWLSKSARCKKKFLWKSPWPTATSLNDRLSLRARYICRTGICSQVTAIRTRIALSSSCTVPPCWSGAPLFWCLRLQQLRNLFLRNWMSALVQRSPAIRLRASPAQSW